MKNEGENNDAEMDSTEIENSEEMAKDQVDLNSMTIDELRKLAKEKGIESYSTMKKAELIKLLADSL